jgi:hypothetical protein
MVPAVNFHALSNTEFHEKEAGCVLSADGTSGESDGIKSGDGGAPWSRAGAAGESTPTAADKAAGSGSAVTTLNGRSSRGRGAGSSAVICIAASETCSQGIGDDREMNAISVTGAGAIGSSVST